MDKQELARCSACRGQSAELYYCERLRGHVCKRCKRKIETRGYTEELDLKPLTVVELGAGASNHYR